MFPMVGKLFLETKGTKLETNEEENKICQTIMTISDNGWLQGKRYADQSGIDLRSLQANQGKLNLCVPCGFDIFNVCEVPKIGSHVFPNGFCQQWRNGIPDLLVLREVFLP